MVLFGDIYLCRDDADPFLSDRPQGRIVIGPLAQAEAAWLLWNGYHQRKANEEFWRYDFPGRPKGERYRESH